jgi:signal transduction histidine kinase
VSDLPGSRFSLVAKLGALAAATQLVMLWLLLWISQLTRDETLLIRALAFALALSPPVVIVIFIGRLIVQRTTRALMTAYTEVAGGNFAAQLPLTTAGADFADVRAAFSSMAAALGNSVEQLRQADLERRRLFADLAHELATPTTTLLGIGHALRAEQGDRAHLLEHLVHETERLERLIADVREVAHLEDPSLAMLVQRCDVGELVTRAVERARIAHAAQVTLRCEIVSVHASVDPLRIDQVVNNLLENAVRHARGGIVATTVRSSASHVTISVEDSGPGVADELLASLGRRMLRIDPSRARDTGGHGLGLSIVCAIAARHGGNVTFQRAALGGLGVDVRLPLAPLST